MRIIGGKFKSRRIPVPVNLKARPTTDFARESLFNILQNIIDWEETRALDLFAGTGSVGLEMVSRGCQSVISVEQNRNHYQFILKAKEMLQAEELLPIKADVFKYLESCSQKFDLIFADPPYDLEEVASVPSLVLESDILAPNGIFIMEHSKKMDFSDLPYFDKEKKYGNVHFSFFVKPE